MNETLKTIFSRRSIRSYRPDPLPAEDRDLIIQSGLYAPSARNIQPWHITVVENRDAIDRITAETKAAIIRVGVERYLGLARSPNYRVSFGAPTFMIVSADPSASNCPTEDCSLVLGTMFLAAHSLGIGSCWVNQLGSISDDATFRIILSELGVPAKNRVYGCAAFGYNAEKHPEAPARREGTVNLTN